MLGNLINNAKSTVCKTIKYEGDNKTIIWKHPDETFDMTSQLIVSESQEALFFKDGQALDLFTAGRYTLDENSIPLLGSFWNKVSMFLSVIRKPTTQVAELLILC